MHVRNRQHSLRKPDSDLLFIIPGLREVGKVTRACDASHTQEPTHRIFSRNTDGVFLQRLRADSIACDDGLFVFVGVSAGVLSTFAAAPFSSIACGDL